MRTLFAIAVLLLPITTCTARVITVDPNSTGDYPTIQEAINAASGNDTIILERGIYTGPGNRDLDLMGKAITISSIDPEDPNFVENTIIDCQGTAQNPHRAFDFHQGEGITTVISGITITAGYHTEGGAIRCQGSSPKIIGCFLTENGAGRDGGAIYIYDSVPEIVNCRIMHNNATQSGGGICLISAGAEDGRVSVSNCLLVSNTAGRDGGAISAYSWSNLLVSNCTVGDNVVSGKYPLPSDEGTGGGLYTASQSDVVLIDSIVSGNIADHGWQITVGNDFEANPISGILRASYCDIQGGYGEPNLLVEDGCTADLSVGNIYAAPRFTAGPCGDYYLSQIVAGQTTQSACVDAGSDDAITLGMNEYTTRSDAWFGVHDDGTVDMGYHYPLPTPVIDCKYCDLVFDGVIDVQDIAWIAARWLYQCDMADRCQGADIDLDEDVDFSDMALVAKCWYEQDTDSPEPQTAQWNISPQPTGPGSVEMSAQIAKDAWFGMQVEYFFRCLGNTSHNSGWRQNYDPSNTSTTATYVTNPEYYLDTGLEFGKTYGYTVRMRDRKGNTTSDSSIAYAKTGHEIDPPLPNPGRWQTVPYNTGTAISMVAEIATDDFGPVQYYFRCTDSSGNADNNTYGGSHSGWQESNVYEDIGLTDDRTYYYRVKARDNNGNETEESPVMSATFDDSVLDHEPPTPNPPTWNIVPGIEFKNGGYWHHMKVNPVTDNEGNGVEYYFECFDQSFATSGWLNSNSVNLDPDGNPIGPNEYWVYVGGQFTFYRYRVQARDRSANHNTGAWSDYIIVVQRY